MDNIQKLTVVFVLALAGYIFYAEGGLASPQQQGTPKEEIPAKISTAPPQENTCKCSTGDVERLAMQIEADFNHSQDQLSSDIARIMSRFGPPEERDNCTWIVTFKISWPFGNTDGYHPDEFIKKRIACDGKEVYVQ